MSDIINLLLSHPIGRSDVGITNKIICTLQCSAGQTCIVIMSEGGAMMCNNGLPPTTNIISDINTNIVTTINYRFQDVPYEPSWVLATEIPQ